MTRSAQTAWAVGLELGAAQPVRMPSAIATLPRPDTIDYKTETLASVAAFEMSAGFGNRATDIAAYTNAGLARVRGRGRRSASYPDGNGLELTGRELDAL